MHDTRKNGATTRSLHIPEFLQRQGFIDTQMLELSKSDLQLHLELYRMYTEELVVVASCSLTIEIVFFLILIVSLNYAM